MNFVINIPGDRTIGTVHHLHMTCRSMFLAEADTEVDRKDSPLHHWEVRRDPDTDKWYAAIVYELTPESVR